MFYGQCSELCGRDHAFMPIGVRVVSKEQFATWLAAAGSDVGAANQQLTASIDAAAGRVAVAGQPVNSGPEEHRHGHRSRSRHA